MKRKGRNAQLLKKRALWGHWWEALERRSPPARATLSGLSSCSTASGGESPVLLGKQQNLGGGKENQVRGYNFSEPEGAQKDELENPNINR